MLLGAQTPEPIGSEVLVGRSVAQHVEAGDEDRVPDRLGGPCGTPATTQSRVLRLEIGALRAAGGLGGFGEGSLKPLRSRSRLVRGGPSSCGLVSDRLVAAFSGHRDGRGMGRHQQRHKFVPGGVG